MRDRAARHGGKQRPEAFADLRLPDDRMRQFELCPSSLHHVVKHGRNRLRRKIKHCPGAAAVADRRAVVDLAGIDRDHVAGPCFDHAPAAERGLRASLDQPDAELIMHMATEREGAIGFDGLDAVHDRPTNAERSGCLLFAVLHLCHGFSLASLRTFAAPFCRSARNRSPIPTHKGSDRADHIRNADVLDAIFASHSSRMISKWMTARLRKSEPSKDRWLITLALSASCWAGFPSVPTMRPDWHGI